MTDLSLLVFSRFFSRSSSLKGGSSTDLASGSSLSAGAGLDLRAFFGFGASSSPEVFRPLRTIFGFYVSVLDIVFAVH
jgi:hypothetical protein